MEGAPEKQLLVWVEIGVRDVEKATMFYAEVFGVKISIRIFLERKLHYLKERMEIRVFASFKMKKQMEIIL
jgi:predicted enzyme related to lactoylglutathione lyase